MGVATKAEEERREVGTSAVQTRGFGNPHHFPGPHQTELASLVLENQQRAAEGCGSCGPTRPTYLRMEAVPRAIFQNKPAYFSLRSSLEPSQAPGKGVRSHILLSVL